ncbi:MAG: hypothetical protein ACYDDF_03785 [Thermoplasmatota archaeon]
MQRQPSHRNAGWALVVLILLTISSLGSASSPPAEKWSPSNSGGTILSFAYSRDGSTVALGLATTAQTPPGPPPLDTPPTSGPSGPLQQASSVKGLEVYDFAKGNDFNWTCGICTDRTAVALSSDGHWLAVGTAQTSGSLALFQRATKGYTDSWNATPPGGISSLALSDNATIVAVLSKGTTANNVSVYGHDGSLHFTYGLAGALFSHLAVSRDGAWVAAAGTRTVGSATQGVAVLLSGSGTGSVQPSGIWSPTDGAITAFAMTPDAATLIAGTTSGNVTYLIRSNVGQLLPNTLSKGMTAKPVAAAIGDHMTDFAVASANDIALFTEMPNGTWIKAWDANATGVAALSMDAAGKLIDAATSAGALGYSWLSNTPLYSIGGGVSFGGVDAAGDHVAFASATTLSAYRHTPSAQLVRTDINGTALSSNTPIIVDPGTSARFFVAVENNGTAPDTGTLVAVPDPSVNVQFNRTLAAQSTVAYTVDPQGKFLVEIDVTPGQISPGLYSLPVALTSSITGQNTTLSLPYSVGGAAGVSLVYGQPTHSFVVGDGTVTTLNFAVQNSGNVPANFTLQVTQSPGNSEAWPIATSPAGTSRIGARTGSDPAFVAGQITIQTPADAPSGATNDIQITAVANGSATYYPIEFTFVVNPIVAANLTSDLTARTITKGNDAWFNVTLKNTGTVPQEFQVTWDPVVATPASSVWNVNVQGLDQFFTATLTPSQTRAILVQIDSSTASSVGSIGTLHMYATDFNSSTHAGVKTRDFLNLSATIVPAGNVITNVPPSAVPAPPAVGVLGSMTVAAVVLALRRRNAP